LPVDEEEVLELQKAVDYISRQKKIVGTYKQRRFQDYQQLKQQIEKKRTVDANRSCNSNKESSTSSKKKRRESKSKKDNPFVTEA